jgi:hypothetical protein
VAVEIVAGTTKSVEVEFAPNIKLDHIVAVANPGIAKYVTVTPNQQGPLEVGSRARMTLSVSVPAGTKAGVYDGVVQIRDTTKHAVIARPLPVAVKVTDSMTGVHHVSLFTEAENPLLMSFNLPTNNLLTLFGGKDFNGYSTSLDGYFSTKSDGTVGRMVLDNLGRPTVVDLPNGGTIKFEWQTQTLVLATVVSPDGKTQANVSLTIPEQVTGLPTGTASDPTGISILNALSGPPRKRQSATAMSSTSLAKTPPLSASATDLVNATLTATVTSAGIAEHGASVRANVIPKGLGPDHPGYNVSLGEIGAGVYSTSFVNFTGTQVPSVLNACNSIVGTVAKSCKVLKPVSAYMVALGCAQLAAGLALVTDGAGLLVLGPCLTTFAEAGTMCNIPAAIPTGGTDALCQNIENQVQLFDSDGVTIKTIASKDGRSGSDTRSVPGMTSEVKVAIALPAPPCTIQSLTTSPIDPAPFQSYLISVQTTCGSGTSIRIAMTGSDGYSAQTTCSGAAMCSLGIPGAEEGIVDTVNVSTSTGETRSTALVF